MRIGIAAIGSTGDIQPYLALARGLMTAGHEVQLFTARLWEQKVRDAGVPFADSGAPFDTETFRQVSQRMASEPRPFHQLEQILRDLLPGHLKAIPVMREQTRGLDVLVAHAVDFAAIAAARANGVPLVLVHLFPAFIRARDTNPSGGSLGRVGDALVWKGVTWMTRRHTDEVLNQLLRAAGAPEGRDVLFSLNDSARAVLLALSPQVHARDSSWPESLQVTGYWFLEEPSWTPPPELTRFLEAGPPPVVVSFGSMVAEDPAAATKAVLAALAAVGCRAIVQAGWAQLAQGVTLPPEVFRAEYVPHPWLLPRAAALVHHGGAGTTAAALRAGVPQVIVWHAGDQMAWGDKMEKLQVAAPKLSHRRLTAPALAKRLRLVLSSPALRERAQALGAQIRAENGVARAVEIIEQEVPPFASSVAPSGA